MKNICLSILFLFFAIAASAQSKAEGEVAAAVEMFNKAMISADRNILEKITAHELSYGHSSGNVQDKAAFVEDVVNGPFDFLTINVTDQMIRISGETAIVRHIFSSEATNGGTPISIKIGNVQIWQKQKGEWKLLARQAFKI